MKRYKDLYFVSTIIIVVVCILPCFGAIFEFNLVSLICFGAFPLLWLLANSGLRRSRNGYFTFSWILAILACCGSLLPLIEIRKFVIINDGFERADGYGSPMALLIDLTFFILAFIGFCTIAWFGYVALQETRESESDNE
ncbi:MAG: hypothetical protein ABFD64_05570 [Armatimonadota bacterium]